MKEKEQTIGCTVYDCKYCNCDNDCCKLKEVKICNCSGCGDKENTMCDNYKEKKAK